MNTQIIIKKIKPILVKQGVLKAALFGSYAKGSNKKSSDVDLLVKLAKGKTLLDLVSLKLAIEEELNKKVDVLTYDGLNPLLKDIILNEQKIIYEKKS